MEGVLWKALLLLLMFCLNAEADEENPILTIQDGKIRGRRGETIDQGKPYYAFQGIPFAETPIGELRFRAPKKKSKWDDIIDATQDRSQCVQDSIPILGSEDCLYMNVYTPNLTATSLAVMVYIYGGGFTTGNSSYYSNGPDFLLDQGVVVAMFNYRLGIFGYISTEDTIAPGNMGLRDQILALNWLKNNIAYFGGDPGKVTLFGISAGAASVSYLLQIPSTKGLFRGAIMDSGTSLCLWALNRRARLTAFQIGRKLGIYTSSSETLIEGLKKIDYKTLQNASSEVTTSILINYNLFSGLQFGPVKEVRHKDAIFSSNSEEQLSQGNFHRIPVIMGFNSNEGGVIQFVPELTHLVFKKLYSQISRATPADLTDNRVKILLAAVVIRLQYFGVNPSNNSEPTQFDNEVTFFSDDLFVRPIRRTAQDMSRYTPVYFYKLSYDGVLGGMPNKTLGGVYHGEDGGYIFQRDNIQPSNENDILTRSRVVKMWTNFAKYMDPTPSNDPLLQEVKWPLISSKHNGSLAYLNINTSLDIEYDPFAVRMRFWDELYEMYGDPPYDTY